MEFVKNFTHPDFKKKFTLPSGVTGVTNSISAPPLVRFLAVQDSSIGDLVTH